MKNKRAFSWMYVVQILFLVVFTVINVYLIQRPVKPTTSPVPDAVYSDSLKAAMSKVDSLQAIIAAQSDRIVLQKQLLSSSRKQHTARIDSVVSLPMNGKATYFA